MSIADIHDNTFEGPDLLSVARGEVRSDFLFSEGNRFQNIENQHVSVFHNLVKLIQDLLDGSCEMFDLTSDPLEATNLWSQEDPSMTKIKTLLKRKLDEFRADRPSGEAAPTIELMDSEIEHLRALGYVDP